MKQKGKLCTIVIDLIHECYHGDIGYMYFCVSTYRDSKKPKLTETSAK